MKEKAAVAVNLRDHRKRKGWSQEQLSENSGVAIRTIQRIENAQVEPHLQTLALLAGSLGVEVQELSRTVTEAAGEGGAVDRKWLILLHLSPVLGFLLPFANLIVPLMLWAYRREDHAQYEAHGRAVVNFHLTVTLAFIAGVAMLLVLFPVGLLLLALSSVYALVLILINTRRVIKAMPFKYPLSLKLL